MTQYMDLLSRLYGRGSTGNIKTKVDRHRLPNPLEYYRGALHALKISPSGGWASARCVFHDDTSPSLSVNVHHGGFRCFGCGESGDLIRFHQLAHGMSFVEACKDLGCWDE